MGFGHENGAAHRDLAPPPSSGPQNLGGQLGNGGHILCGLGGQAEHEVELDHLPAQGKGGAGGGQQILLADSLVDHPPQPFTARLRSQGKAGLADPADLLHHLLSQGTHPHGGKRDRNPTSGQGIHQPDQQIVDTGVVAAAQRE